MGIFIKGCYTLSATGMVTILACFVATVSGVRGDALTPITWAGLVALWAGGLLGLLLDYVENG